MKDIAVAKIEELATRNNLEYEYIFGNVTSEGKDLLINFYTPYNDNGIKIGNDYIKVDLVTQEEMNEIQNKFNNVIKEMTKLGFPIYREIYTTEYDLISNVAFILTTVDKNFKEQKNKAGLEIVPLTGIKMNYTPFPMPKKSPKYYRDVTSFLEYSKLSKVEKERLIEQLPTILEPLQDMAKYLVISNIITRFNMINVLEKAIKERLINLNLFTRHMIEWFEPWKDNNEAVGIKIFNVLSKYKIELDLSFSEKQEIPSYIYESGFLVMSRISKNWTVDNDTIARTIALMIQNDANPKTISVFIINQPAPKVNTKKMAPSSFVFDYMEYIVKYYSGGVIPVPAIKKLFSEAFEYNDEEMEAINENVLDAILDTDPKYVKILFDLIKKRASEKYKDEAYQKLLEGIVDHYERQYSVDHNIIDNAYNIVKSEWGYKKIAPCCNFKIVEIFKDDKGLISVIEEDATLLSQIVLTDSAKYIPSISEFLLN